MGPRELREFCKLSPTGKRAIESAVSSHALSARAHDRIVKLARTRADLEGHEDIKDADVYLAVDARMLDRKGWLNGPNGKDAMKRYARRQTREDAMDG
jgi:magnesium chelatase family protein